MTVDKEAARVPCHASRGSPLDDWRGCLDVFMASEAAGCTKLVCIRCDCAVGDCIALAWMAVAVSFFDCGESDQGIGVPFDDPPYQPSCRSVMMASAPALARDVCGYAPWPCHAGLIDSLCFACPCLHARLWPPVLSGTRPYVPLCSALFRAPASLPRNKGRFGVGVFLPSSARGPAFEFVACPFAGRFDRWHYEAFMRYHLHWWRISCHGLYCIGGPTPEAVTVAPASPCTRGFLQAEYGCLRHQFHFVCLLLAGGKHSLHWRSCLVRLPQHTLVLIGCRLEWCPADPVVRCCMWSSISGGRGALATCASADGTLQWKDVGAAPALGTAQFPGTCEHGLEAHSAGCVVEAQVAWDAPTASSSWSISSLAAWVDAFVRSFCLLQLLSFVKLLLRAIPLCSASPRVNPCVRGARACVGGAPLIFVIALGCVAVHAAPGLPGPVGAHEGAAAVVNCRVDVQNDGGSADDVGAAFASRLSEEAACSSDALGCAMSGGPEVDVRHFAVQVLQFQRPSRFHAVAANSFRGTADLLDYLEDQLEVCEPEHQLFEVAPQPCSADLVLLAYPSRCIRLGRCPVCVQLFRRDQPPRFWLDVLDDEICVEDLKDSMSQDWPERALVFVGMCGRPLGTEERRAIEPGCLIRVATKGFEQPASRTLTFKLQHAEDNLRDPWVQGFSPEPLAGLTYSLLQLLEATKRVQYSPIPGHDALESVLVSHALASWRPYGLQWPPHRVTDHVVRGMPTCLVCGAFPEGVTSRFPLFVDGRRVGLPYRLYAAPVGDMLLSELLDAIGLFEPEAGLLEVSGSVGFDYERRTVRVSEGDVMVLAFRLAGSHVPPGSVDAQPDDGTCIGMASVGALQGSGLSSVGCSDIEVAPSHFCPQAAERSDCSVVWARPLAGRNVSSVDIAEASPCDVDEAVQKGDVLLPFTLGDPNPHNCWPTEQVAELQGPGVGHDGPHLSPPEGGESEGGDGDDDDPELAPSPLPEEWRVPVMLLSYQTAPVFDVLWIARHEPVDSWLVRANILLAGGELEVLLPECQPDGHYVCLLCVPKWWSRHGIHAVLIADVRAPELAFVEVVRPDDTPDVFLPLRGQTVDEVVAVYRCFASGEPEQSVLHPPPATTYLMQPEGRDPPSFVSAGEFLRDCSRAVGPNLRFQERLAPAMRYLLLGPGDTRLVRDIQFGALAPQISAASGMPRESIHLTVQRDAFPSLSIQGQEVNKCIGYRDRASLPGPLAFTLFFDLRRVGMSVCARLVTKLEFSQAELLHLAEVVIPEGLTPRLSGGFSDEQDTREFRDRDSVVVWFEPVVASTPEVSVGHDTGRDDSDPAYSDDDSSRSRTPPPGRGYREAAVAESARGGGMRADLRGGNGRRHDFDVGPGFLGGKWNLDSGVHDAHALCRPEDTSACLGSIKEPVSCCAAGGRASRPLPTPCRAGALLPVPITVENGLAAEILSDGLHTLLDDTDPSEREAYLGFVADRVALGHVTPGPQHVDATETAVVSGKCVLRLAAAVGPPVYDLTRVSLPIGKTLDDVLALVGFDFADCWRSCLPDGISLHHTTAEAFRSCRAACQDGCLPDSVRLFTDGSFDGSSSGWAVVCVAFSGICPVSACWMFGPVCTDTSACEWMGAKAHGVQEAELSAVCVALLWGLTLQGSARFSLASDSLVTVNRAGGLWHFAEDNSLAHTCRALAQANEVFGCRPWSDLCHVRAHQGHAWNELADALAKHVVRCGARTCRLPDIRSWVIDGSVGHLWLLISAHCHPHLWPCFQGGSISTSFDIQHAAMPSSAYFGSDPPVLRRGGQSQWRALTAVTMNVQTLEGGGVQDQEGRVAYLRAQMQALGVHIVAVQEARSPKSSSILSETYVRLCSGRSPTGQYGVELWFSRSGETGEPVFRPDDLTVIFFNPRVLAVKVEAEHLRCVVVCIHAPTSTDPARESWWQELAGTLPRLVCRYPLLLLGDWNAKFHREVHSRVGDLHCGTVDDVPLGAARILTDFDLWLPSTFPQLHVGPGETWFSPGHAKASRIDYIAIPMPFAVEDAASFVLPEVDLGHASLDHIAVHLRFWVPAVSTRVGMSCRPVRFDRQAMSTEHGRAVLRDICAAVPDVPWLVDASSHYRTVQSFLQTELGKAFPPRKRKVAQSFLSDATWVLKDYRVWLKKRALQSKLHARCVEVTAAFQAWRDARPFEHGRWLLVAKLCLGSKRTAQYVQSLRDTKSELRHALRDDRSRFLSMTSALEMLLPGCGLSFTLEVQGVPTAVGSLRFGLRMALWHRTRSRRATDGSDTLRQMRADGDCLSTSLWRPTHSDSSAVGRLISLSCRESCPPGSCWSSPCLILFVARLRGLIICPLSW